MPDLLSPFTHAVAAVLAATHDIAGALGLSPGSAAPGCSPSRCSSSPSAPCCCP